MLKISLKPTRMRSAVLYFALLLCIESNAQMAEWGLCYQQPYVHNNALQNSHENYILSGRLLGLRGNVKSVTQKTFFIQEKKGTNLKLGRPEPEQFFYYRFNTEHEIVESWIFKDTIPSEKKYFRNCRANKLDSLVYPISGSKYVYQYAPDGSLEKNITEQNKEHIPRNKVYHTPDSCCYIASTGDTQCFVKGNIVFEQGWDQFKVLRYHPNGMLKSSDWFRFRPDTFPITLIEYGDQGQLIAQTSYNWDYITKSNTVQTVMQVTYEENLQVKSIQTTTLKSGLTTEKNSQFIYANGRLEKIVHILTGGNTQTETIPYNKYGSPIFDGTAYEYDQHGNWTKRFTFFDRIVQFRTIEYFD